MQKNFLSILFLLLAIPFTGMAQFNDSNIKKLELVTYMINRYYVDSTSTEKLAENAIKGMLSNLDPHSSYISKENLKRESEPLEGSFDGVGVVFQMVEDTLLVLQTISGGPSEKVGVQAGDRFISVNDTAISGVNMQNIDIQKRIRGPKGTTVRIKVLRRGVKDLIEFNIVRDKIPLYSVDASYMANKETGYIKIDRFAGTTMEEFDKAFTKLKKQGAKNLIIDLQDNGGGYMRTAIDLIENFLQKGQMIVYTEGKAQPKEEYHAKGEVDRFDGKLIILVDEGSASASEIVSGAIQDWDRGLIVGRRTFGKGLVQKMMDLPDGSQIRLTTARYYTPSGRCIQRPYKDNISNYRNDLIERYNHGELMHEDSISFPDSLKCYTLQKKRVIYGGGGIMPDIFVPLDTTKYSAYHRNLVAKGAFNKFVINYLETNRQQLNKDYPMKDEKQKIASFQKFLSDFVVTDADMDELVAYGEKEKVEMNKEQYEASKELIRRQVKANIARDLWGTNEYFQIINNDNAIYQKALEIISSDKAYSNAFYKKKN